MYRFLTLVCLIVSVIIVGCQQSSFTPEESEFQTRCPEVKLSRIPLEMRGLFMAAYEENRPVLEGNDVIFISNEQEIETIENFSIERLGEVDVYGQTMIKIKLKDAGRSVHRQIANNYYKEFIQSFWQGVNEASKESPSYQSKQSNSQPTYTPTMCSHCGGNGRYEFCLMCLDKRQKRDEQSRFYKMLPDSSGIFDPGNETILCNYCSSTGKLICPYCNGSGSE
jgi:hypothetical protein